MADAAGTIQLEGIELPLERVEHETITFTAGQGNPVTNSSGTTRGIACGQWAHIDPPSAGEHTVDIYGTTGTFEADAHYTLTVTATTQSLV